MVPKVFSLRYEKARKKPELIGAPLDGQQKDKKDHPDGIEIPKPNTEQTPMSATPPKGKQSARNPAIDQEREKGGKMGDEGINCQIFPLVVQ